MNLRYALVTTFLPLALLACSSAALAQPQVLTLTDDLSGTYTATQTITAHDATIRTGLRDGDEEAEQ